MTNQSTSPSKVTAIKPPKVIPTHSLADEYLSNDQLAVVLNTSPVIIRASRVDGILFGRKAPEFVRVGDRKLTYEASTIREWIGSGKRGTVAGAES